MEKIPFNKPYLTGNEIAYIEQAVKNGKISGNGSFTKKSQDFFQTTYGFKKCLLTTSCTDALEMAAILLEIQPGDEVIMPAYTFVSTANAFVLRGAKIVFADSRKDHPGIDESKIEELISSKTKAIVIVHYAGVACDMSKIMKLAEKNNICVVEDAAHAIDSFYLTTEGKKLALGSIGHLAAFSFHETKNIISGEGGMLVVNDEQFIRRSEVIWEKGTNRNDFFKGKIDKYNWVDIGSSFLPSEIIAAFLWAQIENIKDIQFRRLKLWDEYYKNLFPLEAEGKLKLPVIPHFATNNAHMFYVVFNEEQQREKVIKELKNKGILAVFHYLSLNKSPYYKNSSGSQQPISDLQYSDFYTHTLLRLPFFYELSISDIKYICKIISENV